MSIFVYRQKSLLITSLSIGKQYQLRVTAGNLYGFGLPSTPVPVEIDASKVTKSKVAELESVRGKKIKIDDYDKYCKCYTVTLHMRFAVIVKISAKYACICCTLILVVIYYNAVRPQVIFISQYGFDMRSLSGWWAIP